MQNDSEDAHSMWNKDDEKARYIIAHELGELFYVLETIKGSTFSNQNEQELKNLLFQIKMSKN